MGGIDQSGLIARFNTPLFLWRAEGCLSPHYSLQWEAEPGSVERKDKEMNPLELYINQSNTLKTLQLLRKKDEHTHACKQTNTCTNAIIN